MNDMLRVLREIEVMEPGSTIWVETLPGSGKFLPASWRLVPSKIFNEAHLRGDGSELGELHAADNKFIELNPIPMNKVHELIEVKEKTYRIEFTRDQIAALASLLGLVHMDGLATSWHSMLPEDLKDKLLGLGL